jgi:hypothetical protein
MKTNSRSYEQLFPNQKTDWHHRLLSTALVFTTMMSLVVPSHELSLSTVISALPITSWSRPSTRQIPVIDTSITSDVTSVKLAVPSLQLSMAEDRDINGLYIARDPRSIPSGFVRMCGKAGGYAPRPLWDDLTNGITPWFESKNGCFIYFNCHDSKWWMDDSLGSPRFLAVPDGSLLLPPTAGWVTLTGRRAGVPRMSYL